MQKPDPRYYAGYPIIFAGVTEQTFEFTFRGKTIIVRPQEHEVTCSTWSEQKWLTLLDAVEWINEFLDLHAD